MKHFTKEIRIALVAIAAVVALFFGLNFLKGMSVFSSDDTYYVRFRDISGLSASNPIFADGYRIGVVKDINYDYQRSGNIVVRVQIDGNLRIPQGSTAEIESDLMGNVNMNILLANNPRQRVAPGDTIAGSINEGATGKLARMVPTIEKILPKLDSIMGSLNTLLADPAIAGTLHNAESLTRNLDTSAKQLNTLMATMNSRAPQLMEKAEFAADNAGKAAANLAAVDVAGTMQQVNRTLAEVQQFTSKLNSTEGTVGKLMNDPSLYDNLNSTMRNADSLVVNLREHPKRYVHFSIFGRKGD